MILGNSFGNNRGKKYFIRGKDTPKTDAQYADQAEQFKGWFEKNYTSVISYLQNKNIYNEDIVNDTFIKIYEAISHSGLTNTNFRAYFIRAVFTNYILDNVKESRYCELLPNYDRQDSDNSDALDLEAKQKKLVEDIFNYLFATSGVGEFELFKMYINLKPAVNYDYLAKITGVKAYTIQRIVSKMKKKLCKHDEFLKRRKELI